MNKKTSKILLNGVLLLAMAAVGVTSYQLITSPGYEDELVPREKILESQEMENEIQSPLVDADTGNVLAQIKGEEDKYKDEKTGLGTRFDEDMNILEESTETEEDGSQDSSSFLPENVDVEEAPEAEITETASSLIENTLPAAAYLKFSEDTRMEWPVHGNILLDYDMEQTTYFPTLDQYRLNPAISVQAVEGAPVVASAEGVVYEIEEDPRTGMTVTMELGNGYQAIYGQLKELTIYEGERIEEGTTIGYIAKPTKYYSEEGSNLYFAMKKDGKPIDPILYLP